MDAAYVSADDIRDQFSKAMSAMYQQEVPQYGTLLSLVERVNRDVLANDADLARTLEASDELGPGALRLTGTSSVSAPEHGAAARQCVGENIDGLLDQLALGLK